jgi:putative acetyltransferase
MSTISIRPFKTSDTPELIKLFRDAVHAINIQHYSPEQIAVWAPEEIDEEKWHKKLSAMITFVAEINGIIVGFADMTHEGYLDHLYIHKDYQGRFIAVHLLRAIEKTARELGLSKITTHCSITVKLPAERMGFKVIKEQTVERKGVKMINYVMEKVLK